MKTIVTIMLLLIFLSSGTLAFAKPKNKDLKLNRGQVQSSVNKVDKLVDLDLDGDDMSGKGKKNKKGEKGKKGKKGKDLNFEKSVKKESKKALRKMLK